MKPLDVQWRRFEGEVIPIRVTKEMREFARMAFYAGAFAMMGELSKQHETDEDARRIVADLSQEMEEFIAGHEKKVVQ
jgi:hypothetical protein